MKIVSNTPGVTASVRQVPTDATIALLPLTPDRVGVDPDKVESETPTVVGSLEEVFRAFRPRVHYRHTVDEAEFVADLEFERLADFDPEAIRTRSPGQRNDIADLHGRIEILQELRSRFALPKVRKAWEDPEQRRQILEALRLFQLQIHRIASGELRGDE